MGETIANLLLLGLLFTVGVLLVVGPLTALGIMFWNWHKELSKSVRLRQARTTQISYPPASH